MRINITMCSISVVTVAIASSLKREPIKAI